MVRLAVGDDRSRVHAVTLQTLIQDSRAILLDFDGPVCYLFARLPAPDVAQKLRDFLRGQGVALPSSVTSEKNPLNLLTWTDQEAAHLLADIERLQTDAEIEAARLADPTPGVTEILQSAEALGKPVVVVTNNSAEAVDAFLKRHSLSAFIAGVASRVSGKPYLMKPDPHLVLQGAERAGHPPSACLLIGDSPTDIEAAKKAGTRSIGYAKRLPRVTELAEAGADVVVESMQAIADAMATPGP